MWPRDSRGQREGCAGVSRAASAGAARSASLATCLLRPRNGGNSKSSCAAAVRLLADGATRRRSRVVFFVGLRTFSGHHSRYGSPASGGRGELTKSGLHARRHVLRVDLLVALAVFSLHERQALFLLHFLLPRSERVKYV